MTTDKKIRAAYVGPPADFIDPPVDVTEAGEPVFIIGADEAEQSDNWRPLAATKGSKGSKPSNDSEGDA